MRRAATLPLLFLLTGCSAPQHQAAADRETKAVLAQRRTRVPEAHGSMDVDAADRAARPVRAVTEVSLDLPGALCLAAQASREYRAEREAAYLAALAFTGTRHDFRGKWTVGGDVGIEASPDGSSVSGGPEVGLSRAFEQGGSFVLSLASDFLKGFRGDPLSTATTLLTSTLLLPLARGGGVAARETLTQAERDVLYALRDFARFQQEFVVDVATSYYRVLEQRDNVANADATYRSLETTLDRARAYGPDGAGRLPDFQVDQARQDLLRAEERRIQAQQAYEAALDAFKQDLGLPVTTRLVISDEPLDALRAGTQEAFAGDLGRTIATALERRLDLRNARDRREDAERRVAVAADALGVQADLEIGGDLSTPGRRPLDLEDAQPTGRVGLDLDLPVDRVAERNAYRSAQIAALASRRAMEGLEDAIVAAVRQAFRTLEQTRQSRRIQEEGVRLAQRRVESASLHLEAGTGTIRDRLEAEDALIEAKDALTRALVDHAIARMQLDRDAGTLVPAAALACPPASRAGSGACAPVAAAPVPAASASSSPPLPTAPVSSAPVSTAPRPTAPRPTAPPPTAPR